MIPIRLVAKPKPAAKPAAAKPKAKPGAMPPATPKSAATPKSEPKPKAGKGASRKRAAGEPSETPKGKRAK